MSAIQKGKWRCRECRLLGTTPNSMLSAPNPFDPGETIHGCPRCRGIDCFVVICDAHGCTKEGTCGWPSPDGYRVTCFDHWNRRDAEENPTENG